MRVSIKKRTYNKLIKTDSTFFSLDIPITGISFDQALQFCSLTEKRYNRRSGKKIRISLPTIQIYKQVIENKDSIDEKKCFNFNSKLCNCGVNQTTSETKSLVSVFSYKEISSLGLINIQGNVSEMTNIKGIAMGGSFRHYAIESYDNSQQEYKNAEDWLGFRFILTFDK